MVAQYDITIVLQAKVADFCEQTEIHGSAAVSVLNWLLGVGDLGLSKVKCNTLISGCMRGTIPWMAPELLYGNDSLVFEKVGDCYVGASNWRRAILRLASWCHYRWNIEQLLAASSARF